MVYVGRVFVGCIVYADDIALLSGSCHGLQKMADVSVCSGYGGRLDIRFNTSKSQTAVFGGCCTPNFTLTLNDLAIPVVGKVKYLVVLGPILRFYTLSAPCTT